MQIPEKDQAGNIIPDWKRQMMAKKAAERAKKEFEERMAKEAENRRLSQIPQWKRDLLARREETENKLKYMQLKIKNFLFKILKTIAHTYIFAFLQSINLYTQGGGK